MQGVTFVLENTLQIKQLKHMVDPNIYVCNNGNELVYDI